MDWRDGVSEPKPDEPGCVVVWERRKTSHIRDFLCNKCIGNPHALLPEKDMTGQVRVADTGDVAGTGLQGLGLGKFSGTSIPGVCRWAAE